MNRTKSKHYQDTFDDDVDKSIQVRVVNTTNFYRLSTVPMRCGFVSIQTFNIIMLGVSFCLLYTAFTPTQVINQFPFFNLIVFLHIINSIYNQPSIRTLVLSVLVYYMLYKVSLVLLFLLS